MTDPQSESRRAREGPAAFGGMAKATVDREMFEHMQRIYEHAKAQGMPEHWDRHWASTVATCNYCDLRCDLSRPGNPEHGSGCALTASLAFVETWLRVEGGLIQEQEDDEDSP